MRLTEANTSPFLRKDMQKSAVRLQQVTNPRLNHELALPPSGEQSDDVPPFQLCDKEAIGAFKVYDA